MTDKAKSTSEAVLGRTTEGSTARTEAPTLTAGRARPTRYDAAVLDAAIDALLPAIEEWASGEDVSDARDILRDALQLHDDGYKLARDFERAGWDVDFQLADILNQTDSNLYRAIAAATRNWIVDNRVEPRFSLGINVTLPPGQDAGARGEITGINTSAGTYTVFVASLGHVREGLGTHGRIFTWEALEAANLSPSALSQTGEGK